MGFACAATFPPDVLRAIGEEMRRRVTEDQDRFSMRPSTRSLIDQLPFASGPEVRLPSRDTNYRGTIGDPGMPQHRGPEYPGSPSLPDPTPPIGGSRPYFVPSGVSSGGPTNQEYS